MNQNEVKILYCVDENGNYVFYNDAVKGEKYYCIECKDELVVKDGKIKIKHLAHKNNTNCSSSGETIFHKHYKENLFKSGMFIEIGNAKYEIMKVSNEVNLNKYYDLQYENTVISDILLNTSGGDVAIEINYSNPKDWIDMYPKYNRYNLKEIFEVKVSNTVNYDLEWNRAEDLYGYELDRIERAEKRKQELERQKLEALKPKVGLFYMDDTTQPKYSSEYDCTTIYGTLYTNDLQKVKRTTIDLKGNLVKQLRGEYLEDKQLFYLKMDIRSGFIKIDEDGFVYNGKYHENINTYKYKDLLKKHGGKWNPDKSAWNVKDTIVYRMMLVNVIGFKYTGELNLSDTLEDIEGIKKVIFDSKRCYFKEPSVRR